MNDLLIVVRTFNRAEYLKQCLLSLENNTDLECDFLLYQDGLINRWSGKSYTTQEQIDQSIKVCEESCLPNKTLVISNDNIGGANVKVRTLNLAFPRYSYLMMLDNDIVVSKDYIKTIKKLFKRFANTDVGMIQTSYRHFPDTPIETKEYFDKNKNKVTFGFSHRWEQGVYRETWTKVKPLMEEFIKINARNDTMMLVKNDPSVRKDYETLCSIYGKPTDDYVLETCIKRAGLKGVHTMVLKHKSIGENGQYTMNSGRWFNENFDSITLFNA